MTETLNITASNHAKRIANTSPYPFKSIQWQIEWQRAYYEYLNRIDAGKKSR